MAEEDVRRTMEGEDLLLRDSMLLARQVAHHERRAQQQQERAQRAEQAQQQAEQAQRRAEQARRALLAQGDPPPARPGTGCRGNRRRAGSGCGRGAARAVGVAAVRFLIIQRLNVCAAVTTCRAAGR